VARPRVAGGVLWIGLVAVLLAGIVALNVAALRLNVEAEQLDARADELAATRDALATELSSAASAGRIEALAVRRLRLERPAETTYIRLGRPRR
jgi:cell division protein FtsL